MNTFTKTIFLTVVVFFTVLGCADRDRENPLDPKNPVTGGKPTGLTATSSQDTVFLRWDRLDITDMVGYNIYRRETNSGNFNLVDLVEPDKNRFADSNLNFETTYEYQISVRGKDFESERSESVAITPGPTFNWAADNLSGALVKLTHDALHEIVRAPNFFNIIDIAPNRATGDVWVVDILNFISNDIVKVAPDGQVEFLVTSVTAPIDIEVNSVENTVWAVDSLNNEIVKLDSTGSVLFRNKQLSNPFMLSLNSTTGDCWVADNRSNVIIRIGTDGQDVLQLQNNFGRIRAIAVNSVDGTLWVADNARLLKFSPQGDVLVSVTTALSPIFKLDVDESNGGVWVLSLQQSKVARYSNSGVLEFATDGFSQPDDLSVNFFNHSCLVADTNGNRIVKISAEGSVVAVFQNLGFPDAVAVQNQP